MGTAGGDERERGSTRSGANRRCRLLLESGQGLNSSTLACYPVMGPKRRAAAENADNGVSLSVEHCPDGKPVVGHAPLCNF